jgi:hypothetical protein
MNRETRKRKSKGNELVTWQEMVSKKEDNDSVSHGEMKAQPGATTRDRGKKGITARMGSRGRERGRESGERPWFDKTVGRKRMLERYDCRKGNVGQFARDNAVI